MDEIRARLTAHLVDFPDELSGEALEWLTTLIMLNQEFAATAKNEVEPLKEKLQGLIERLLDALADLRELNE